MQKTSLNVEQNVASFLCYLLGWVSGLVILLLEKENKLVRFHAAQSIVVFGTLSILQALFGYSYLYGFGLLNLIQLAALVLWIFLMVKAWKNELVELPVISDFAKQLEEKVKT